MKRSSCRCNTGAVLARPTLVALPAYSTRKRAAGSSRCASTRQRTARIAEQIRAALDAADLDAFADLLDPHVTWGAPGDPSPPCRNRGQVLDWYRQGRADGRRGRVLDVISHADKILLTMKVTDRKSAAGRGRARPLAGADRRRQPSRRHPRLRRPAICRRGGRHIDLTPGHAVHSVQRGGVHAVSWARGGARHRQDSASPVTPARTGRTSTTAAAVRRDRAGQPVWRSNRAGRRAAASDS